MTPTVDELYAAAMRLHQMGRSSDAAKLYDLILTQRPSHYGALHLKGVLALQAHRYDEALGLIERSLSSKPEHALALSNLGVTLRALKRYPEAIDSLRKAVAIDPNHADALANLAVTLKQVGEIRESVAIVRRALDRNPERAELQGARLFALNYLAENDPVDAAAEARSFGRLLESRFPPRATFQNLPDPERPLRIGLVSADFRSHPVARFLLSVLRQVDATRTSLIAYSSGDEDDTTTAKLKAMIPHWRDVMSLPDTALEAMIVDDGIDVLVDLSGHTGGNRLGVFARKPAPVSFTWLGYFATTGLTAIDYVLANRWVVPEAEESQWTEKVWRMPDTYLCFTAPETTAAPSLLPALRRGEITFGCFNNFNKITDEALAVWAQLLAELPHARLILRSSGIDNAHTRDHLRRRLAARGLSGNRVRIDDSIKDYHQHLRSYDEIDIALDPFPYNGGTTTVEALYMGVPVLVRAGDRYVSHMGESILHNAGLSDWIAPDAAGYATLGVARATDLEALASLRAGLRARMLGSPLFDAPRFAANLEDAWRGMWRAWCATQTAG